MAKTEHAQHKNNEATLEALAKGTGVRLQVGDEHTRVVMLQLPTGHTLVITTVEKSVSGTPLLAVSTELIQPQ